MSKPLLQFAASTAFALLAAAQDIAQLPGGGLQAWGGPARTLLAQTTPLRGLNDDPRSYLPSARQLLDQQQNRQQDKASTQRRIEESERRQTMERLNDPARNCTDQTGAGCAPPQGGN